MFMYMWELSKSGSSFNVTVKFIESENKYIIIDYFMMFISENRQKKSPGTK